jgi:CRP/FNR family transcriptional regulator, cyclic AMP receptor protein
MQVNLNKIPLILGMQEEDLHALADKAVIKTFPKNVTVLDEGESSGSLYVILAGKVKVYLADESGKELILDIKGAGGYFGEMALDERPRSATVVTLEASRFAVFSRTDFKHLLLEHPEVSQHVIKNLIHIVRGLNKNVRSLAMLNVYGRVSQLLLDLAVDQHGTLVISEKLTQKDMANRVGSSREMVSRIFRGLSLGGYIKVEGKKITINKSLPPHL